VTVARKCWSVDASGSGTRKDATSVSDEEERPMARFTSRIDVGAWCGTAIACTLIIAAAAVAASPALVPYADPDKQFTIQYPSGWHVRRANRVTTFYLDDPDEGTAFSILPGPVDMKGEYSALQVFETLIYGPAKKEYPDFKVMGHREQQLGNLANGTVLEAIGAWTNTRHVSMHGYAKVFAVRNIGRGTTTISLFWYQAPARDYDRLEPTFNEMVRTTRYTATQHAQQKK
jgi:hypothetical protein